MNREQIKPAAEAPDVPFTICPFRGILGRCNPECMLYLTECDEPVGSTLTGRGHCSFAVLASAIGSKTKRDIYYLVRSVIILEDDTHEH